MMSLINLLILLIIIVIDVAESKDFQCLDRGEDADKVVINLEFQFSDKEGRQEWIYRSLSPLVEMSDESYGSEPEESRIVDGKLQSIFCIDFEELPPVNQHFILDLGPRKYKVAVRPIKWKKSNYKDSDGKFLREGLMSTIFLHEQSDPDWIILRSARLLRSIHENVNLIEILIDNRSKHSVPIRTINFDASHIEPMGHCASGDPKQQVTLSWGQLISTQSKSGVWTTILDTDVHVQAEYSFIERCSPLSFYARIPVQLIVEGGQISRITLELRELPDTTMKMSVNDLKRILEGDSPSGRFRSLTGWRSFKVQIESDHLVFPEWIEIER